MNEKLNSSLGIIISTYNNIDDLNLVIEGYRQQTDKNFILYIADDGSTSETADFITKKNTNFPVVIQHIWHEDKGFRLSAIRNLAIIKAKTPYLIITDGDCIPLSKMVETHRSNARLGSFVTGGRLLLSKDFSQQLRTNPWPISQENKIHLIRRVLSGEINRMLPLLLPSYCGRDINTLHGIKGCHLAFWRDDLLQVNGFDESFEGWGREDSDLVARLLHSGIWRRNLRGSPVLHLWHEENSRNHLHDNDALLQACLNERRQQAIIGIRELSTIKESPCPSL